MNYGQFWRRIKFLAMAIMRDKITKHRKIGIIAMISNMGFNLSPFRLASGNGRLLPRQRPATLNAIRFIAV